MGSVGTSSFVAGIAVAVASSFINGSTFVLQKKGILRSRARGRGKKEPKLGCAVRNQSKMYRVDVLAGNSRSTPVFCNVLLYFP